MQMRAIWLSVVILVCVFPYRLATADPSSAGVVSLADAPKSEHPKGAATVSFLVSPKHNGSKSVFVSHLFMKPGTKIPEHRDATEEVVYILKGTGEITIEGQTFKVGPGDCIYMPANVLVSFKNGNTGPMEAIQVFAPPGPEKKYDTWNPLK